MTDQTTPLSGDAAGRDFALVVLAYRCAMAETCGAQLKGCAGAWEILEAAAPRGAAGILFGCFFQFARSLLAVAERPIGWRQTLCARLCHDEWLAIGMIDAAQRGDLAGLLAAAAELIGVEGLGDVLDATQVLACALAERGVFVCPRCVCGRTTRTLL